MKRLAFRPLYWTGDGTGWLEAFSAGVAWIWSLVLLWPGDTFPTGRGYDLMARFAPEWVWAAWFAVVAALHSGAMCGNIRVFRYPAALLAGFTWSATGTLALIANPAGAFGYWWLLLGFLMVAVAWHGNGR